MVPWSLQVFGKSTLSLNPLKLAQNSLSSFKNQFQADEPYSPCIYSLSSVESKLFEHSVMFYTHGFPQIHLRNHCLISWSPTPHYPLSEIQILELKYCRM